MLPVEIVCGHCGWRNEPTARMCGGCGQPLREFDPAATAAAAPSAGWAAAAPITPQAYAHDAPTALAPIPVMPGPYPPDLGRPAATPPLPGSLAPWPGADYAGRRSAGRRDRQWRIPVIALVVLAVLASGLFGAWALIIQPSLHTTLDTQLRSALNAGVDGVVNSLDAGVGGAQAGEFSYAAAQINAELRAQLPADSPISDIAVAFTGGKAVISYSFWGGRGSVATTLLAQGGKVTASGTSVDCPLCFIEGADEMQAAFNDALGRLPASLRITRIRAENDALSFVVG